jgi:hypothetical protein
MIDERMSFGRWDLEELKRRTKDFAHKIVRLALMLPKNTPGESIRKQLIRYATFMASNTGFIKEAHEPASIFIVARSIAQGKNQ